VGESVGIHLCTIVWTSEIGWSCLCSDMLSLHMSLSLHVFVHAIVGCAGSCWFSEDKLPSPGGKLLLGRLLEPNLADWCLNYSVYFW